MLTYEAQALCLDLKAYNEILKHKTRALSLEIDQL